MTAFTYKKNVSRETHAKKIIHLYKKKPSFTIQSCGKLLENSDKDSF